MTAPPDEMRGELRDDVGAFAEKVLGQPLWDHQLELARSPARYRVVCAGRQCGKSTSLAVLSLHHAATHKNALVLIVSAGETASKRLLDEVASLALGSKLLAASVLDAQKSQLTLSNGSRIVSVPASTRQIRGASVSLLLIDEAGWVDQDIWRAAEPAIAAKPGSRVILSSSPWGSADHFFRSLWQRGMDSPNDQLASWHWPSTVSPLMDAALLEQIRQRETPEYFNREFLAEWTDASGSYFTEDELMAATADYELTDPDDLLNYTGWEQRHPTCAGVDWGVKQDANALTLLGLLHGEMCQDRRWRIFVPWMIAQYGWQWSDFIGYIQRTSERYQTFVLASEVNGVGSFPTTSLKQKLHVRGNSWVSEIWTDARRKQSGFSKIKGLMQEQRLVLPRHPELLRQLRSLEFEISTAGTMKIAVPETAGHDDLAMSLLQAVSSVKTWSLHDADMPFGVTPPDPERTVLTAQGVAIPRRPIPGPYRGWIGLPEGREKGEVW